MLNHSHVWDCTNQSISPPFSPDCCKEHGCAREISQTMANNKQPLVDFDKYRPAQSIMPPWCSRGYIPRKHVLHRSAIQPIPLLLPAISIYELNKEEVSHRCVLRVCVGVPMQSDNHNFNHPPKDTKQCVNADFMHACCIKLDVTGRRGFMKSTKLFQRWQQGQRGSIQGESLTLNSDWLRGR